LALIHPVRLHLPAIGHALLDPDIAVSPLLNPFDALRLGPLIVLHPLAAIRLGLSTLDAVRADPLRSLRLYCHPLHARRLAFRALHARRLAVRALHARRLAVRALDTLRLALHALDTRRGLRSLALLGAVGALPAAMSARTRGRGRGRNRQGGYAGGQK
jgi:hypothetical protein